MPLVNMKSLLVFALCCITCCLTAPGCTEHDLMKCSPTHLPDTATEEELLERDCSVDDYGINDRLNGEDNETASQLAYYQGSVDITPTFTPLLWCSRVEATHIECVLELYGRCGIDVFFKPRIPDYFPEKGYKKILNSVCVKTNPIRKKALDTATCSRNAMYDKDLFRACGMVLKNREEYCRDLPGWLQCLVDSLNRECGPDAGEAYPYGNAIHYDPYDCLE